MPFVDALGAPARLHLVEIDDEGRLFKLARPLPYRGALGDFEVPIDFVTDFASVPRFLWSIVGPYGRHTRAAVLHDWLYSSKIVSRREADALFRRAMRELGVVGWRRWGMWAAVRLFGWTAWHGWSVKRGLLELKIRVGLAKRAA